MKKINIFPLAIILAAPIANAQGLHESIGVDGKYVREVIVQEKIFTLPQKLNFKLDVAPLPFAEKGVVTPFAPDALAMPTVTPFADRRIPDSRGYLNLGLGSWLDGNLSAGYRFIQNQNTTLGAVIQANSSLLWKPHLSEAADDVKRSIAAGQIALYASHRFRERGVLDASAAYSLAGFNYYGYAAIPDAQWLPENSRVEAPTQTVNQARAQIGWSASPNSHGFSYDARLSARYFGYRALYAFDPQAWFPSDGLFRGLSSGRGDRETSISLNAAADKRWKGGSRLGADLDAQILLYSHHSPDAPDNYGKIGLKPYYRFSRGLLNINVGAHLDFILNAGTRSDRYQPFRVAPDIRIDWRKKNIGLFLNLLGGTELCSLSYLNSLDLYSLPAVGSTRPIYSPLDATMGANFGPFSGFDAGVALRFKVSRDVPLGGWYMYLLNFETLPGSFSSSDPLPRANIHGISLSAHAAYSLGSLLKIKAQGSWQPQNGRNGFFNGYDRPRWIALLSATVSPLKPLSLELQYQYRGVRSIQAPLASLRLPDITLLNFRAAWQFNTKIAIFLNATNLLNRHDPAIPLAPTPGVSFLGGLSLLF